MSDVTVSTNDLTTGNWDYVDEIERVFANILANLSNTDIQEYSEGYCPQFDYTVNNKQIEQKMSIFEDVWIEYARYDGSISGLSETTSDYYMCISGDRSGIGVVRMFKTSDIKEFKKTQPPLKSYEPDAKGPGRRMFLLDPFAVDMVMLGTLRFDTIKKVFNVSSFEPNRSADVELQGLGFYD